MKLCDYGCGQEAKYPFKNGKWCCSKNMACCLAIRKRNSIQKKKAHKDPNSKYNSKSCKEKQSNTMKDIWKNPNNRYNSVSYRKSLSDGLKESWNDLNSKFNSVSHKEKLKPTIEKIKKLHPFFSKIEELRENKNGDIQVHCKNHNCKNSKEKDGWFIVTKKQLHERVQALENPRGFGESNFYCSQHCKDTCQLYNVHGDPYKENNLPYTYQEYLTCRTVVFKREKGLCEYCGEPATDMHHIFSVKIEPFFALDPDYCVACCEKHHYEYAHEGECSTGNLAKIVCSVESQKFLNQTL